jgi:REP element-mobilizing transposase RayT
MLLWYTIDTIKAKGGCHGHLWNDSYFVETIGSTSEENIRKYIERQQNCQALLSSIMENTM